MSDIEEERVKLVEVMYNKCYGGFQVSREALQRYIELKKIMGFDMTKVEDREITRGIDRTDEIMIKIVKELGTRANCKYSDIGIRSFPLRYKDHIEIGEYDGYENAYVNLDAYKLANINKLCNVCNDMDHESKIAKIKQILDEKEEYVEHEKDI